MRRHPVITWVASLRYVQLLRRLPMRKATVRWSHLASLVQTMALSFNPYRPP
ncbi:hypothetical protein CA85_46630 [Allorhodopirellula solitaria]|uniref:Uncharacterized protein n=1 Tax=Allorhodopirellula solitaria TaxID=2527987 RepID=A0A5C5X1C5_9BACT|nr:hypothetical protein CA85_46630 [Allorhodopirellula solitaria]